MAFSDYHACDNCGDAKTFYDSDMDWDWGADGYIRYSGHRAFALCQACEQTHEIRIVTKPADGWRPIDTAPKDGTWVMCWGPDCLHGIAKFGPNPIWAEYPEYTHWMPLPATPPAQDQKGDGE